MNQISQQLSHIINELRLLREQNSVEREILSVRQAAEFLGLSEYTIREWVRLRRIPHSKVNGTIKFRRSKLIRWIDQGEIPTIE